MHTRPCLRISEKIFPEIVIILFLGEVNGLCKYGVSSEKSLRIKLEYPIDIAQSLYDEIQSFLVVAHTP